MARTPKLDFFIYDSSSNKKSSCRLSIRKIVWKFDVAFLFPAAPRYKYLGYSNGNVCKISQCCWTLKGWNLREKR